jgi:hypothetical protein
VEVFDDEDDRALAASLQPHLPEHLERSGLDRPRRQRRQALRALPDAQELEEVRPPLAGIRADPPQPRAHLLGDPLRAVGVPDPEVLAQDVEHRQIGHRPAVGRAGPLQVRDPLPAQALPELEEQPRLADAGLAEDADHLAVSPLGRLPAAPQELELLAPPHEGGHSPSRREPRGGAGLEAVGSARRVPGDCERRQRQVTLEEGRGRLAHRDAVGSRRGH